MISDMNSRNLALDKRQKLMQPSFCWEQVYGAFDLIHYKRAITIIADHPRRTCGWVMWRRVCMSQMFALRVRSQTESITNN